MKYQLVYTSAFKKGLKRCKKQGRDILLLEEVVNLLLEGKRLPKKYYDHGLQGNWKGYRECHIQPDWLLIYLVENDVLTLTLISTGSHSELLNL